MTAAITPPVTGEQLPWFQRITVTIEDEVRFVPKQWGPWLYTYTQPQVIVTAVLTFSVGFSSIQATEVDLKYVQPHNPQFAYVR